MFARLGRLVVHHPWKVIAVWLLAAVVAGVFAPKLTSTTDQSAFLPTHYESIQAMELQEKAFPDAAPPAAVIVFKRADDKALAAPDVEKVGAIVRGLSEKHLKDVNGIQALPGRPDAPVAAAFVQMPKVTDPNDKTQTDAVTKLREELQPQLAGSDLKAGITGAAAQQLDQEKSAEKAQAIIGIATILLIIVLLLVIFRSPVIAFLPILTIGGVSVIATGLIGAASKAFDWKVDGSVTQLLTIVLFGIGTDYILFLMFRYRERLRAGDDSQTAMIASVTRVGEAVTSAAGAVIIAFLALTLSSLAMFAAMGPALAIAVAVTVLAALTLIPAIVSLLGTKVFWPSKSWRKEPKNARFTAMGKAMARRPALFAAVSGGVLAVLAVFSLGFNPSFDMSASSTGGDAESMVWSKEMIKAMPAGMTQPSDVYLRSDSGAPLAPEQLATYREALAKVPGVGQVGPKPELSADKSVADFQVVLNDEPTSDAALDIVDGPLRDAAHAAAPQGTQAYVGGMTSVLADLQTAMNRDYRVVFPVAAIAIMVVLGLLLRSLVAPWYLMASVGLGFAATLGATVLVFQHGLGHSGLMFMIPLIMYLFVVALGTDYNILMIARLREEAQEGHSPREAASMSLRHAGPTVAAAGLILAGTFASMLLAGNASTAEMGFAISLGIAIAAFVMALFFTPALTALIGHAAWWPGHGDEAKSEKKDEEDLASV